MKKYYSALFLLALILMGCSSTYTIKNFSSKEKFYKDFNSSVGSKDMNITLSNDSLYEISGGGLLKHDTLYTSEYIFPVNIIKTVQYKTTLKSTLFGIFCGELVIGIAGGNILHNNINKLDFASTLMYGSIVVISGGIIGGIAGYFIGWDVTYQFNP
jgi:hypothetical protein